MKVLFLTNIPSPYRVDFFQELGKLCDLTVLYELEKANDRNREWERNIIQKSYTEVFLRPIVKQDSSAWCPSVTKYLRNRSYDVIVVGVYSTPTGMQAVRYLKRCEIPYFINCDGGIIAHGENYLKRKLKTYLISGAAGYLSTGMASDEYLTYYGAENDRIYHYPFTSLHGYEVLDKPTSKSEKVGLRKQLGIREEKVILTVGKFIPRKGFDILLEAAGLMCKEYGIYLVGGEENLDYCEIRQRLNLCNIHYIPFKQKEQLQEYYRAADLFVFPTREDIWGLVINEAMAAGLPVITTECCVAGVEMLEAQCIIPAERADVLAEKVKNLLDDENELKRIGEENLAKSRDYTIEKMAERHMEIFMEAK